MGGRRERGIEALVQNGFTKRGGNHDKQSAGWVELDAKVAATYNESQTRSEGVHVMAFVLSTNMGTRRKRKEGKRTGQRRR